MARKKDTLLFDTPPVVSAWAAAGGKKECHQQPEKSFFGCV